MKKYLIHFACTLIITITSHAQSITFPLEEYYKNNNDKINNAYFKDVNGLLDKYLGTWEYNENGHYLKIQFFKVLNNPMHPSNSIIKMQQYCDVIYARFEYKKNGVTIYNTLNPSDDSTKWFIRSSCESISVYPNKLLLYYKEPSSNPCGRIIRGSVNIEYSNTGGIEKLSWVRSYRRSSSSCMDDLIADHTPFQIPSKMTLIKID